MMNMITMTPAEARFKEACAWQQELLQENFTAMGMQERKAYRKALAHARHERELALIELDFEWSAPPDWYSHHPNGGPRTGDTPVRDTPVRVS